MPKDDVSTVAILLESSRESGRALLRGITKYLQARRRWSVYWEASGLTEALPRVPGRLDGLILRDFGVSDSVLKLRIPTIVVGHLTDGFPGCINVVTDDTVIPKMGAEHLLARGYTSYAFCGLARYPSEAVPWSEARRRAFVGFLKNAGFACHTYALPFLNAPDWGHQRNSLRQWLLSLPRPVGCMAANDDIACEMAAACKQLGLCVPDEVGILGADNDDLVCCLSDPPLSSIAIGFERAGYEAAEALDAAMQSRRRDSSRIVAQALHIVARRSTDATAVDDPNIAKALRFIRDQPASAEIYLHGVVAAAGLSRRALERRFKERIGKTIAQYIRELRVSRIAQMLIETNLPVASIADAMGFHDVRHLARYFRSVRGMTPLAFRKAHKL